MESFLDWYHNDLNPRERIFVDDATQANGEDTIEFLAEAEDDTRHILATDGGESLDDVVRAIDEVEPDRVDAFLDDAPDAGGKLLDRLGPGADRRLLTLHEVGEFDQDTIRRLNDLMESGEMDQADAQRMFGILETKDSDPLVDRSISANQLLSLGERSDLSKVIGVATRDGGVSYLGKGDSDVGWDHIRGRHVEGSIGTSEPTSFFPTGQTIQRQGTEVELPDTMTEAEVQRSIMRTIDKDNIDESDTGLGTVYQCGPTMDCYVPKENIGTIRVVTDTEGRVITAYPEEGPNTVHWSPTEGWKNV